MYRKVKQISLAALAGLVAALSVAALMPSPALAHENCTYMGDFKRGSYGNCVRYIQTIVNNIGLGRSDAVPVWMTGWYEYSRLSVDGSFGPATETQVKKFQGSFDNLTADGRVGPKTWNTMCRLVMNYRSFGWFKPYWPEGKDANQIALDSFNAAKNAGCERYYYDYYRDRGPTW